MATLVPSFLTQFSFFFAGIEDMHKCLNEFEFQPDATTDY